MVLKSIGTILSLTIKGILTGILLWWLLRRLDVVWLLNNGKGGVLWAAVGLGVLLQSAAFGLGGLRWWLLLRSQNVPCSYPEVLSSYYLGVFFNNFLPTGMGGDVVRTVRLRLLGYELRPLIVTAIVDRVIGLTIIVAMGTIALPFWGNPHWVGWQRWLPSLLLSFGLLAVALLLPHLESWLNQIAQRVHWRPIRMLFGVAQACCTFHRPQRVLLAAAALTLLLQSMVVLVYILIGWALDIHIPLPVYFVSGLVVFLAASLPISIGGLGVREGALAGLLVWAGAEGDPAVALALLSLVVLWVATLPGGLVFIFLRLKQKSADSSAIPMAKRSIS